MARALLRFLTLILLGSIFHGCGGLSEEFEDVLLLPGTYRATLAFPTPTEGTPDPFKGEVEITFRASEPIGPGSFSATASEQRIDGSVVKNPAVPTGNAKFAFPFTIEWTVQFSVYDEATGGAHQDLFYEITLENQQGSPVCTRARGREAVTIWEVESCQAEKL